MPRYRIRVYEPCPLTEPRPQYKRSSYGESFTAGTGKEAIKGFLDQLPYDAWYVWNGEFHVGVQCEGWYEKGKLYVLERKLACS